MRIAIVSLAAVWMFSLPARAADEETPAVGTPTPLPTATPAVVVEPTPIPAAISPGAAPSARTDIELAAFAGSFPAQDKSVYGIESTIRPPSWRFGVRVAVSQVESEHLVGNGFQEISRLIEFDLGAKAAFTDEGAVRPWIGAGVAVFDVAWKSAFSDDGSSGSGSDVAVGGWLAGGVDVRVIDRLVVGAQFRHSEARVDGFFGEVGGTSLTGSLGVVF